MKKARIIFWIVFIAICFLIPTVSMLSSLEEVTFVVNSEGAAPMFTIAIYAFIGVFVLIKVKSSKASPTKKAHWLYCRSYSVNQLYS